MPPRKKTGVQNVDIGGAYKCNFEKVGPLNNSNVLATPWHCRSEGLLLLRLATLLCSTLRHNFPVTRRLVGRLSTAPLYLVQDDAAQVPPEAADHPADQEKDVDAELEALAREEDVDAELQALTEARQWHSWLGQAEDTMMQIYLFCGDTSERSHPVAGWRD